MDAIRFDPSISGEIATGRRRSGGGGDMFADMLGDQLKKRAEAERSEPVVRRRKAPERRPNADPVQGRPVRPIIKHARHAQGDGPGEMPEQRRIAATDRTRQAATCMDDREEPGLDQAADAGEPEQDSTESAATATANADDAQQPIAIAAVVTNATDEGADSQTGGTMAGDDAVAPTIAPASPEPLAPESEIASPEIAADATAPESAAASSTEASAASTAGQVAAESTADSAADAFAATLDAAAAAAIAGGAAIGSETGASPAPSATSLTTASLATLAAPQESAMAEAGTANPAAETADLTATSTPETPHPAEPAKLRPLRAAPAAEIRAHQPAPAASQSVAQAPAQPSIQAAQQAQSAGPGESTATTALAPGFEGDGVGAPGWTLHLAQGAAAKRPDFIAQLRQHLQDLPAHEQVAVNIQRAVREGTGRLSIQLSPTELGQIHVKLEIDEDKRVTAAVTVEKPSTLELLQRDGKALERALHDAGLKMDGNDLSFSLGRHDGKEFSQDMKHSGPSERGGGLADAQDEGDVPTGPIAQVDTAAGLVNLEI